MISFKVSQLDLIALKRNNVKFSNNTITIVLIAKGTQGRNDFGNIIAVIPGISGVAKWDFFY